MKSSIQKTKLQDELFVSVKTVLEQAQSFASQSVNFAMVNCYYAIGKLIVEDEQRGKLRATYAKNTLDKLSRKLIRNFGKGYSVDNLENMRRFYLTYGRNEKTTISETVSRKSTAVKLTQSKSETVSRISIPEL
ncbi:MAG: DUF1016 N-terminal domain-containing protein, partial [Chitinophagales bacterium]